MVGAPPSEKGAVCKEGSAVSMVCSFRGLEGFRDAVQRTFLFFCGGQEGGGCAGMGVNSCGGGGGSQDTTLVYF